MAAEQIVGKVESTVMNPEQIATAIVDQIFDVDLIQSAIKIVLILVVVLLIKFLGESIVGYLRFRLSQNIIKGTPVIVDGEMGRVKRVTLFTILIETTDGWMPISTKEWGNLRIIKLRDQCLSLDRRAKDRQKQKG